MSRIRLITLAGWIALTGNLLLAGIKLSAGIISGSLAVLGDGIDTATDVVIAAITLVIGIIIARPSDKSHPWGHGRAETTATLVLSFIIFFSGAQLCLQAIQRFTHAAVPPANARTDLTFIVTAISIAGKLLLSFLQYRIGTRAESSMIRANAQNMRNDVVVSISVLISLCASRFFDVSIADSVAAFLVGLWIIKNAIIIFAETNMELMDGSANTEQYKKLFDAIKTIPEVTNPHRVRIRKIASRLDIDLDIEVDAYKTVHEAHALAGKVERALHEALPDIYDIMVHIEPKGESHRESGEQYGLSENDLE
jgi:cation diffusion facilitator family transporter